MTRQLQQQRQEQHWPSLTEQWPHQDHGAEATGRAMPVSGKAGELGGGGKYLAGPRPARDRDGMRPRQEGEASSEEWRSHEQAWWMKAYWPGEGMERGSGRDELPAPKKPRE